MAYECDQCGACCRFPIIEIAELDLVREPRLIEHVEPFRIPLDLVLEDDDGNEVEEEMQGYGLGGILAAGAGMPCHAQCKTAISARSIRRGRTAALVSRLEPICARKQGKRKASGRCCRSASSMTSTASFTSTR